MKLFFLLLLFPTLLSAQTNYTLSGKITDSETGEDLIGASILVRELTTGTITNSYGFYSLSLPRGIYTIQYSYLGYEEQNLEINFNQNQTLNIEIIPLALDLDEVVITAEGDDKNITSTQIGVKKINLKEIDKIPVFFGENDILKTIQLLPGISNSAEGSTGFNVRGGSMGQNLILLDEASVYSSSHLMGFFSVFNSDALKSVTVYKGGIPAYFGGRVASVLDITMNNGNNKKFSSKGGVGLVASRLMMEGPIIKDKMSFIISGRRTYGDLVAKLLLPGDYISDDTNFYFYDLNAKLNYSINAKNRLFLSGYFGKDVFSLGKDIGTNWGNTTGTLRWNHLFSERFFSNTSLVYSNYNYGFLFGQSGLKLKSGIEDLSFKEDATWFINPDNTIKTGGSITYHQFSPGQITTNESSPFEVIRKEKYGIEASFYIRNQQNLSSRLSANYGLRISGFSQVGPAWFYNYDTENNLLDSTFYDKGKFAHPYLGFEPRLSLNYKLNTKNSLKLSYNRMAQYLHLLSNTTVGSPTDVWVPSSNNLKPVFVDHFSIGYFRNFRDNDFETSIEFYYKDIDNIADFKDGADILFGEYLESQVFSGKGRSYGMELFVKKNYGTVSGWLSYTLSRTENKITQINQASWYPVRYDKTHDFSIVTILKVSKRTSISGVWTYATGNAITFPSGKYKINRVPVPWYTERNGYRMPAYHRMDLSLTIDGKKEKKFKSGWDFSFYNVYNRYNAYIISFRESQALAGSVEAVKLSLFGIVPAITYKFAF